MTFRTAVLSACGLALLALMPASAHSATTDPAAGLERARAAGIKVDADAARAMIKAPIGSCFNDPTQAKCPPARVMHGYDNRAYATPSRKRRGGATAYAAVPYGYICSLEASGLWLSPANWMHGDGWAYCDHHTGRHELYVNIDKKYNGSWYQMDAGYASGAGGQRISVSVAYKCTAFPWRDWRTQAYAYQYVSGQWISGYHALYRTFYCG